MVLFLLSLVGGVLAVVVKARRKMRAKETVQSQSKVENGLPQAGYPTDSVEAYQNELGQPTPPSRQNTYDYATASDIINPASATASFYTNVYDSAGGVGYYERTNTDEKLGAGHYEVTSLEEKWGGGVCDEDLVKGVLGGQKKSSLKMDSPKVVKPEDLYAQPVKVKKKWITKKDGQVNETEEVAAPCDDLYAKPDMTKKKAKRSQQHWEQESEERKLVPTAPLPYKKHLEMKQETDEDEADIPDEPVPFSIADREQYYNTKGGAVPPTQDGNCDYAVVNRQQK